MGAQELPGIAAQLYALPYSAFVAARAAAATELTAAGAAPEQRSLAAEVRSLPKPSLAAWAVNMLAAHRPETLAELAELGGSMRAAQSSLEAAALRTLGQERRQLLSRAVKTACAVAEQQGRKISSAVATEVEETLRAATADEGAAAAVRSGCLLRTLRADGVDVVDLAGAVAVPGGGTGTESVPAPGSLPAQPRLRAVRDEPRLAAPSAVERARAGLQAAEETARTAAEEALRCDRQLADATAQATRLAEEAGALREQLARTEDELKSVRKHVDFAAAKAQQAARAAGKERRKEALARERLLRLGNTPRS